MRNSTYGLAKCYSGPVLAHSSPPEDPSFVAQREECAAILVRDCGGLPNKQSQVIALRYGPARLTQGETARVLEVPRSTVARLEHQSLERLRRDELLRRAYGVA